MLDKVVMFEPYSKVSVDEFLPELQLEFPDMPSDAFAHYVLRSIDRIARDGNVLRRTATIHTERCIENYLLEPPDCMTIVNIMKVCNNGCNCCTNVRRLTSEPCCMTCGTLTWFQEPNTILFRNHPSHACFKVTMSVAPTWDTCEVDTLLLHNHYELVLTGARYMLMNMSNKPWSSVNRAQELKKDFVIGIRSAAIDTMMGNQRGGITATKPRLRFR